MVAFDLYGTLLDVGGLASRLTPFVGAQAADLLSLWRKRQLERTWQLAYEPFDAVTAHALEDVAPHLSSETREQMCATWLTLPAPPAISLRRRCPTPRRPSDSSVRPAAGAQCSRTGRRR